MRDIYGDERICSVTADCRRHDGKQGTGILQRATRVFDASRNDDDDDELIFKHQSMVGEKKSEGGWDRQEERKIPIMPHFIDKCTRIDPGKELSLLFTSSRIFALAKYQHLGASST